MYLVIMKVTVEGMHGSGGGLRGVIIFFFFFKQKTAYEMLRSLVGSEMCIRDRLKIGTIADLIEYRSANESLVERVAVREIETTHGLSLIHI